MKMSGLKEVKQVPKELQDKVNEINKWIQNPFDDTAEAYWHESSDFGDEWKIRIIHEGRIVVDSLCAATADGHTFYLFLQAMKTTNRASFKDGAEDAMRRLYKHQCEAIGVAAYPFKRKD